MRGFKPLQLAPPGLGGPGYPPIHRYIAAMTLLGYVIFKSGPGGKTIQSMTSEARDKKNEIPKTLNPGYARAAEELQGSWGYNGYTRWINEQTALGKCRAMWWQSPPGKSPL
eukprot:gb/GEZN01019762.1/.p1 GENE.gb/GEZN01019762.1/~~gb/GEZN01019762.1/.p1  ORF type:complete len:112 (+),score=8.30 gb/GEZN01019762.1/:187-522(+)